MTFAILVACQTALARLLCAKRPEEDDLADVAAAFHMRFTGPVAGFASLPLRSFMLSRLGLPVRPMIIARALSLMTSLAGVGANV